MTQLSFACGQILAQLEDIIIEISGDDFCRPSYALHGATIGQHIRHTLEFFICLENGSNKGVINYDRRAHDKQMETDRALAIASIARVRNFLERQVQNKPLVLEVCYQQHDEDFCTIQTSYHRELAYTIEHAVHHMAIMKIAIREIASYIQLDEHFGVAASTIRFKESAVNSEIKKQVS